MALDPKNLPTQDQERRRIASELAQEAKTALSQNQPLVASLKIADALMLFPNERDLLDQFDEIVFASQDPLSLFPVATGAIHVATAAGRARVLMIQKRLPEAIELIGAVLEVNPTLGYLDWVRRWLQPHVIQILSWDLLMGSIIKPALLTTLDVPVPPSPDDPRLPTLRSASEIFAALLPMHGGQVVLWAGSAMIRRRLGDVAGALEAAGEGVRRFPQDWGLRTSLLNALRDAKRPDEAFEQAKIAMQIDPSSLAPLHDAAWGYLDAGRADVAAQLFGDLVQRDPHYPDGQACLHYARARAFGSEADKQALVMMRDRRSWDATARRLANELDAPVPYVNVLPGPGDAAANFAREVADELAVVMRCCGQGAKVGMKIRSRYPESPSARVAFDMALRAVGAGSADLAIEVATIQNPDPRANKGRVDLPVWTMVSDPRGQGGAALRPVYAQGDPNAQQAIGRIAYQPFRKDVWDPAARDLAASAGPQAVHAFMSVFTNPPAAPDDFDGVSWTFRCQVATAIVLSHMGPWESGPARAALYSLVSGPSDWVTIAGIVAFAWRSGDSPQHRGEVDGLFGWMRTLVSAEGFTPWEHALIHAWSSLGAVGGPGAAPLPDALAQDLAAWARRYDDTVSEKNEVESLRRYGGLTLEEYAAFSSERDRLQGGLVYGGVAAAMRAAFSPSPAMQQLCAKYNINPGYPFVPEWQEAINASPGLQEEFIEAKQAYELQQMGVNKEEKAALDEIRAGNMDMHLRMAQAQEAQRAVAQGGEGAGDPDPVVFPGQKVARLSDYVRILKGMQTGNMMGALAPYGLDMMSYGQVAQAWGAKMAADPVLTEKFSKMMNG